jgi:hypothetical protein
MRALLFMLLAASLLAIGCRTQPAPAPYASPLALKGVITAPPNAASVAGRYYRTLGCSSIYLTLAEDGTYFAELGGLASGESRGRWRLEGSQVRFDLPYEKTMTTVSLDYFSPLAVLNSERGWALLSGAEIEREFYEKYGISAEVCFIKTKAPKK